MAVRPKKSDDPKKREDEIAEISEIDVRATISEAEGMLRQLVREITKSSNTKQLAIGGVSGWLTGYLTMKVGRLAATTLGGSIILIQIAAHKGYINLNWNKINRDLEAASNKIAKSGAADTMPNVLDKAVDYFDRQAEEAGRLLKNRKTKARRWYHRFVYGKDRVELSKTQVFYVGFVSGAFAGVITANIF